jgi:hypothetical protein
MRIYIKIPFPNWRESQHKTTRPPRFLAVALYSIQISHASLDIPPRKVIIRLRKRLALPVDQAHSLFHRPNFPRPLRRYLPHKIRRPLLRLVTRPAASSDPQL